MAGSYTYDPAKVTEFGIDRMRFELGDTMVEGKSDTSALTDEEIKAALDSYPGSWKRAKLFLLESLYRRFSYEVDAKTGPLWLYFQERAKTWKQDYEDLKKEISIEVNCPPKGANGGSKKPPYFYAGMQENERTRTG
mgnify:CR=1 FL=1